MKKFLLKIKHFVSKDAFNIEGFGKKLLKIFEFTTGSISTGYL